MALALGQLLRAEDRFLGFLCVFVDIHYVAHRPDFGSGRRRC